MSRPLMSAALAVVATVVTAAGALAGAPTAHADPAGGCAPLGSSDAGSHSPVRLYRYAGGPITACIDTVRGSTELGGWTDGGSPREGNLVRTTVSAVQGDCVALTTTTEEGETSSFTRTSVFDVRAKTVWFLGGSTGNQYVSTSVGTPIFGPACSAAWRYSESEFGGYGLDVVRTADARGTLTADAGTTLEQAAATLAGAPPTAATIPAHAGTRPRLTRAPTLTRTPSGRITAQFVLNRAARSVTIVFAGSASVRTPRGTSVRTTVAGGAAAKRGATHAVTVTACQDGCATKTYRVKLR